MELLAGLVAALALIGANALFCAGEFALVAVDRTSVESRQVAGDPRAVRVMALLRRLAFHLSGTQLGITLASLLVGFLTEPLVAKVAGTEHPSHWAVLAGLLAATVVQLVVGELVPKYLAVARPYGVASRLAPFLSAYGVVMRPLVVALNATASRVVRLLGIEPRDELDSTPSREELRSVIRSSGAEGTLDDEAARLAARSIRFADKTAADVLVPRLDMVVVPAELTVAELAARAHASGYSRFPVVGRDLDDVVGVVLAKDVFAVPANQRGAVLAGAIATAPLVVPESKPLDELLLEMRAGRTQLALVVDEYGGTAGLVTMEDLVEEIVGDIADEYDDLEPELTRTLTGDLVVDASIHPEELAEACGLVLPEGEYETLAGFALDRLGRIPEEGDRFDWNGWVFVVDAMERRRIAKLTLVPPPGAGQAGQEQR